MLATSLLTTHNHIEFALQDIYQAEAKVRFRRLRMLERASASKMHRAAASSEQLKDEKIKLDNASLKVEAVKVETKVEIQSDDEMVEVKIEESETETPQLSNAEMFALKGQSSVEDENVASRAARDSRVASDDEDVAVDDYGRSLTALLLLTRFFYRIRNLRSQIEQVRMILLIIFDFWIWYFFEKSNDTDTNTIHFCIH